MDSDEANETDQAMNKLDVEYRQILRIIKPYIQTINNNSYLLKYRVWLEKLSGAEDDEKFVRNQYLMELARQIQCRHLATPFTKTPPRGPLVPLKDFQCNSTDIPIENQSNLSDSFLNKQKMCQQWTADNKTQWPYHPSQPRPRRSRHYEQDLEAHKYVQRSATSVKKISLLKEIDDQCQESYSENNSYSPQATSPARKLRSSSPENEQTLTPQTRTSLEVIEEDCSDFIKKDRWYELSDNSSLTVLGSGDTDKKEKKKDHPFEKKIDTLMTEINGLRKKSEKSNETKETSVKNLPEHQLFKRLSSSEVLRVKKSPEQVLSHDEPNCVENNLSKDHSYLTSDWKKIIESLQVRLSETQQQNKELNSLTSTLHKKIKEMDATKEQVKQDIKKQVYEQHKKEIDSLKNINEEKIKTLEETHQKKIEEIQENWVKEIEKLKLEHTNNIREIEEKYSGSLRLKDKEIDRLEDIIQRECTRLVSEITVLRSQIEEASSTNTSNDERILFLQKCITKMDRLFQKSEREYYKQIEKLKQELENREKAIKIQLQTQKADVISRCGAEKQSEVDLIVQSLEAKYVELLEGQQMQMSNMREEYDEVIRRLTSILDQHNVSY